jgi:LysR family transcriptional regulator, glycine cleavage system transcriptional activator
VTRRFPGLGPLRTFEAAARHLSFTKAADELGVTPGAVSVQVRAIEEQLGVRLFWRTSRAVRLTGAGEAMLRAAREALDVLARAVERVGPAGDRRVLTVSVGMSFAAKWLVPRLERFRRLRPGVDVRLDVTERLADFAREEVDVAIRFGSGAYPGLRADPLFAAEEVFPVCGPRLLEGERPLRQPADLRHHVLIHEDWRAEGDGWAGWPDWPMWLLAAGVEGVDPSGGIRFKETALVIQAAVEGQGVALGAASLVGDDLAAGRLVRPFALALKGPARFAYHLVAPRATADRPLVKAFRDWVLEEMRGTGGKPGP